MQIPILSGIYADSTGEFRTSYPRNMVPVPKSSGIAEGYLAPGDGIAAFASGPGVDRGGFNWEGVLYRVMGTKLVRVARDGTVTMLGDVGAGGNVTMDAGFGRLAVWAGGGLYYWDGAALSQVSDPDLGAVIDGCWLGGYFVSTDGQYIVVTELNDPMSIDPLKYGSSEADPDPIMGVGRLRNELYAFNRYTIEAFENVGGDNFPFERIDGALVERGVIGTHARCKFLETFAFLGGARDEAPAIWLMSSGTSAKLSTREIDVILQRYSEEVLAHVVLEARVDKGHQQLLMHLPDECWIYDAAASKAVGEAVWYSADSGLGPRACYRARHLVWCYDTWVAGDPTSSRLGTLTRDVSTHYEAKVGWEFGTVVIYNAGKSAIVNDLELVALTGRVTLGLEPTIWASYSLDGEKWSQERPIRAGKAGETLKRLAWRQNGTIRNWRVQRFRGTSDAHVSVVRLEAALEPLSV